MKKATLPVLMAACILTALTTSCEKKIGYGSRPDFPTEVKAFRKKGTDTALVQKNMAAWSLVNVTQNNTVGDLHKPTLIRPIEKNNDSGFGMPTRAIGEWFTIDVQKDKALKLHVDPNNTGEARSAVLTLFCGNAGDMTVKIKQY